MTLSKLSPGTLKAGFPEGFSYPPYLGICDPRLFLALMLTLMMEVAL